MNYLDKFSIPVKGIKEGNHEFKFEIGKTFFDSFDTGDFGVKKGNLTATASLHKSSNLMELTLSVKGTAVGQCDICLDDVDIPVDYSETFVIKFGPEYSEDDKLIVLPESKNEFNIGQLIFEFINVNIPVQCAHPEDENGVRACNQDMIDKLKELKYKKPDIDPRWNELQRLMNNN